VRDAVGADHARVADVDHVRVREVEPEPEAGQEDDSHGEIRDRDQRPQRLGGTEAGEEPEQQHPREQIGEHGIHERHRREDLAAIEEDVRDRERQQHEQVEVQEAKRAAPVHEGHHEREHQRDPDVGRIDLAPKGARQTPCHLPCDLRTGPDLDRLALTLVHDDLRDLVAAVVVAHLPAARADRVSLAAGALVVGQLFLELRRPRRDGKRLACGEAVPRRRRRLRLGPRDRRAGPDGLATVRARAGRAGKQDAHRKREDRHRACGRVPQLRCD
jgi:hypothetical protein